MRVLTYRGFLHLLRRRWRLLFLGVAVAVISGAAVNLSMPRRYESTVRLRVGPALKDDSARLSELLGDQPSPHTLADLTTSPEVLDAVIARLGLRTDAARLARDVRVRLYLQAGLLDVTVSGPDPQGVAASAEAFGQEVALRGAAAGSPSLEAFRAGIQRDIEATVEQSRRAEGQLAQLDQQIAARPTGDPELEQMVARRQSLTANITDWQSGRTQLYEVLLKAGFGDSVAIVGPAKVPTGPATPSLALTSTVAAVLGLGLGIAIALGLEWFEGSVSAKRSHAGARPKPEVGPVCDPKAIGLP